MEEKNKKIIVILTALTSVYMFAPKNTYAITSSDYETRNLCNNKYELAGAHTDSTINHVSCYNTYNEAKSAMTSNGATDLIILDSTTGKTKIVDAQYALLDLSVNPETLTYFYESSSLTTRKYTYMDTGSLYGGVDGALLDVNYGKSVKVKIGGLSAWIKDGTYEIVPLNWVKSSSSYTVNSSIRHNYVAKIQDYYSGSNGSTIGPKPEQLSTGTYFSYDGHYFYKDRLTMIKDYKNNNYNNAVNKDESYYNYYMYLSNHSKTTYSSLNIDEYIRNNMGISEALYGTTSKNNSSRLYGQGTYFYYAQEKYGANALLSLSLNRNESANGRSSIAINKNNGFGLNAVDSNPSQSANWFPTYANSILEFAYKWITDGYADPSDGRYFGPAFGDKYIGMNVSYASDTYWSEKMAANYYSFDLAKGLQDYNYYQLGIVNGPTNAYMSPTQMSQVVYKYPEKDDNVIIVDEIVNAEGAWYKLQSDKIINGSSITTTGDYNWDSYVYVKKEQVTKINKSKNGYQYPNNVIAYNDSDYTYDLYVENAVLNPKVAITTSNVKYYYDSTLEQQTGHTLLKDKWVMVYATAYNKSKKAVSYLVTSNYLNDQKHWIPAGNMNFKTTGYGKVTVDIDGAYTWVNSSPHDLKETVIGGQYTYSYVPLITTTESDGYTWYKVPVNLETTDNSYGWTISSCKDVNIQKMMYNADEDNKKIEIESNEAPIINVSDKTITQGDTFNSKDGITAIDKEDGNLTDKITVSGTVDNDKVGTYTLTYSVEDSKGSKTEKKIIITVIKNEEPTITANDQTITQGTKFNELSNVTAKDKEDGDITKNIKVSENTIDTSKIGEYKVVYKVTDSYNQTTTKEIKVTVVKDQEPVINAQDQTLTLNSKFNELDGVSATDSEDGDLTRKIEVVENTVDTSKLEDYKVIYKVVDSYGNEVTKDIKVSIIEKKIEEKSGSFYFDYLKKDNNSLAIKGYNSIKGIDNNLNEEINYYIIFENTSTNKTYKQNLTRIINKSEITRPVYSNDGKDYTYSWFKGNINIDMLPDGDYKAYIRSESSDYYSENVISNKILKDQISEYTSIKHLTTRNNYYDDSIALEFVIRSDKIADKTANSIYNEYNQYRTLEFTNNKLHIKGTSYSYGMDLSDKFTIDRKIIFESLETYKKYEYNLDSINDGMYEVGTTLNDNLSKKRAWFDKTINIENIPKGTYAIYISTKSNISDYNELTEILQRTLTDVKNTINEKTYTFSVNEKQRYRVELNVK